MTTEDRADPERLAVAEHLARLTQLAVVVMLADPATLPPAVAEARRRVLGDRDA